MAEKVHIDLPVVSGSITNPVHISGHVLGTWLFEGEIVTKIVDSNGVLLGQGPLVASDDWMTVPGVSIEGVIPFTVPSSSAGFVVIEAYNSQDRASSPSFRIPVVFGALSDAACIGDACGSCTVGSMGTNGVCLGKGPSSI